MSSNRLGQARSAYREVQERHEDIKRIERTLTELAQLFNDVSGHLRSVLSCDVGFGGVRHDITHLGAAIIDERAGRAARRTDQRDRGHRCGGREGCRSRVCLVLGLSGLYP